MGRKFESVRLTHAQSVPDHYFANQVYQPIDDDYRESGSFLILFDHSGGPDAIFVASLVNTLIREYYRSSNSDRLSSFEQTLVRLNDQLRQYVTKRESTLPAALQGTIVLCLGKEIHITFIGTPYAVLLRKNESISLIDDTEAEASPSFSLITSGEVFDDDVLVLLTQSYGPETKDDITFALTQEPIYESGRALARIIKQKQHHSIEGQIIHFNGESDEIFQVYLDRPLETSGERVQHYRSLVTKQGHYLLNGLNLGKEKVTALREKSPKVHEETTQSDKESFTEPEVEAHMSPPPQEIDSKDPDDPFEVRNYWQSRQSTNEDKPKLTSTRYTVQTPAIPKGRVIIKPRTIYLLAGILIVMFILIRIINAVSEKSEAPETITVDRAAIITLAEESERTAEASRLQNDIPRAIENYLLALSELNKIPDSQVNEQSKNLTGRITMAVDKLTTTVRLSSETKRITTESEASKLFTVGDTLFGLDSDNSIFKLSGESSEIIPLPEGDRTLNDAAAFDKASKIAVLTQENDLSQLYVGDTQTLTFELKKRSDGKDWPASRLLSSFDKNLYLVGDTISKATPRDTSYRLTPFGQDLETSNISSLVEVGGFFYAIDNKTTVVRLDAKGPKTAVAIHGVPESFLPQEMVVIPTNDNTLWLLESSTGRLINITTDGTYKSQVILPNSSGYTTCTLVTKDIYCGRDEKDLSVFSRP